MRHCNPQLVAPQKSNSFWFWRPAPFLPPSLIYSPRGWGWGLSMENIPSGSVEGWGQSKSGVGESGIESKWCSMEQCKPLAVRGYRLATSRPVKANQQELPASLSLLGFNCWQASTNFLFNSCPTILAASLHRRSSKASSWLLRSNAFKKFPKPKTNHLTNHLSNERRRRAHTCQHPCFSAVYQHVVRHTETQWDFSHLLPFYLDGFCQIPAAQRTPCNASTLSGRPAG